MEIDRGHFTIHFDDVGEITEITALSMMMDSYVIIKYKQNSKYYYTNFMPDSQFQRHLFFEITNNSQLWNIIYDCKYSSSYTQVIFKIMIEPSLIMSYINSSFALNYKIADRYKYMNICNEIDLSNKSIISYLRPKNPPTNFKLKLYDYQKRSLAKMIEIENNATDYKINYGFKLEFEGIELLYDPVFNRISDDDFEFKIKTNGGVLSDDMGLGKTITSIALIATNPAPSRIPLIKYSEKLRCDKINSKATLILCPSHLCKQWETEIRKCSDTLKVLTIISKTNYNSLTFGDFMDADIIITSYQFLTNFKFYPTLHYRPCTPSSFNFIFRNNMIKNYLETQIRNDLSDIKNVLTPLFEFFIFNRLILDEGHEILGELSNNSSSARYIAEWITTIDANYYWYVTGTPFINFTGVRNCAKFINLKMEDEKRRLSFDYNNLTSSQTKLLSSFMNKEYIWSNIFSKICIRHRKCDVENQIKIPGYIEKLVWLKFTDLEKQLYMAKSGKVSIEYLQQLCCHPLIIESSKKIFGDAEVDLSVMQDKLIDYHKNNYDKNKDKLSKLDPTKQEYNMLKKHYETQMAESKYLHTILERMKSSDDICDEECVICMDVMDNPTLTACGHLFCNSCIKTSLSTKKKCPMCKADLNNKELLVMNLTKPETNIDPLIEKYGSKLGKLISMISNLVIKNETRIIIFSQWDYMLSLVGRTLAENGIENCFVKGNVWSRNAAIRKFKMGKNNKGDDNKVIMLSLRNAASGTNLTEATHIFFVEPINASKEECKTIECQAIARACRVGQKQQITLIRILIEGTIEEDLYRRNYDSNISINTDSESIIV